MEDFLRGLLSSDFMPHGHCYLWQPAMVWLQVLSNLSIGAAYMSISLTLAYLAHRIRDLPFQWMYVAFGVFIITCGFTHFMDVWVIWRPNYWFDGSVRAITAVASVGTAVLLFPLIPKAVALAGTARLAHERGLRLEELNVELAALYKQTRETLAEAIPQLVWTNEPDGAIDYRNRRWNEFTDTESSPPDAWWRAMYPDDIDRVVALWRASLSQGEPFEVEARFVHKDTGPRWHLVRALPLRDEQGRILRWFSTGTDIHEQKLAAEARELLLAKTQEAVRARDVFVAVAAHELKTPLTPLRLQIEGALRAATSGRSDRVTPPWIVKHLSSMERSLGSLERLVAVLLETSRIAGGRLDLSLEEVDLSAVVREVAEQHQANLARSGSTLELRLGAGAVGHWDKLRLEQVVTNLLANAINYGLGGPITIEVQVETEATATPERVILHVMDRGIGIAPEDQSRIFEQFERAVSERHYGGLGLGLWIVRQLVQALGGTVRVESTPDAGTNFTVELPIARRIE
jgi:hypothetical protein